MPPGWILTHPFLAGGGRAATAARAWLIAELVGHSSAEAKRWNPPETAPLIIKPPPDKKSHQITSALITSSFFAIKSMSLLKPRFGPHGLLTPSLSIFGNPSHPRNSCISMRRHHTCPPHDALPSRDGAFDRDLMRLPPADQPPSGDLPIMARHLAASLWTGRIHYLELRGNKQGLEVANYKSGMHRDLSPAQSNQIKSSSHLYFE